MRCGAWHWFFCLIFAFLGLRAWGEELLSPAQAEALRAVARGEKAPWPEMDAQQAAALHAKAEAHLGNLKRRHMPHGLVANVLWTNPDRTAPLAYDGLDGGACWTGHYLAALALRFHATHEATVVNEISEVLKTFDHLTKVAGREGYLAAYAGPARDKAYRSYYEDYGGDDFGRIGLGKRAYEGALPYSSQVWLAGGSQDAYDGAAVGLAACLVFVDVSEVQSRARALAGRIGKRLVDDDWNIVDGKGGKILPSPLWQSAWMRLLQTADPPRYRHLHRPYEALFEETIVSGKGLSLRSKYDDEYFLNNALFDRLFVLGILETDPKRRQSLRAALRTLYPDLRDHLNAQFASVYLLVTDDKDPAARAALQGCLLDFPQPPLLQKPVDLNTVAGVPMRDLRYTSHAPLPHERPVADFLWQHAPCLGVGGENVLLEYPGLDLILPYWLGRESGAIPAPAP